MYAHWRISSNGAHKERIRTASTAAGIDLQQLSMRFEIRRVLVSRDTADERPSLGVCMVVNRIRSLLVFLHVLFTYHVLMVQIIAMRDGLAISPSPCIHAQQQCQLHNPKREYLPWQPNAQAEQQAGSYTHLAYLYIHGPSLFKAAL